MTQGIDEGTQNSDSSADQASQSISRSRLVQRLLSAAAALTAFLSDPLTTQAANVAGTEQTRDMAATHQYVLQLATSVATADGFASSAMNLANELATRTVAARVSIGWLKGNKIKLKAISHSEEFDRKQELSVQLERV